MNPLHRWLVTLVAGIASTSTASAQSSEWDRTLLFYFLGAGLDGTTQVGPLETDIDQSFSDILENLDAGFMGAFRTSNGTWAHTIDAIYMGLEAEVTGASGATSRQKSTSSWPHTTSAISWASVSKCWLGHATTPSSWI